MRPRSPAQRLQVIIGTLILVCTAIILLRGGHWAMSDRLRYFTVVVESLTGLSFIWMGASRQLE